MKVKAVWNGEVIAESDQTLLVEGNHYFPPAALVSEYFEPSDHESSCFWKGKASYYDVVVDGKRNPDAAWYYPEPSRAAEDIKDYVAFWKGVEIKTDGRD
ncbi:MAG: DUF427 domain-containing protein [Anaerolineales bacterium]|jgi:uncharacterized protein (DUF427 family)